MKKYFISLLFLFSLNAQAQELYFVDAHSQVDHHLEDMSITLKQMQENGVKKTILAARGKRKSSDIVDISQSYPDKIIASIRTKSGAYKKNKQKYYKKLNKRYKSGNYSAIAEVILYHAQKGDKAEEVDIMPDDERVKAALNVALDAGWPFVFHIEFSAISGKKREAYFSAMESMLQANPDHAFVIIHMGQLNVKDTEMLITKHKNIYFLTSHADPITIRDSRQPWTNLFENEQFKPDWKKIMIEHKDRFIFALDNVWTHHWTDTYPEKVNLWRKALSVMPQDVAQAIAHGNAERLWKLK